MNTAAIPRRVRKQDPQGVRQRILDASADLFQQQGYNATGMQDIFASANISSGAFYHHFATKRELGLAVIRERVAEAVAGTWLAPVRTAPTALAGIVAAFREVMAGLDAACSVRGCPVNNLAMEMAYAEPDFRQELLAVFDTWRRTISDRLQQDQPGISTELATAAADYVIACYSGAMSLCKVRQSSAPLADCLRLLTASLPGLLASH